MKQDLIISLVSILRVNKRSAPMSAFVLATFLLATVGAASAGIITAGAQQGLLVRGTFSSFNPGPNAANDFEFQACTREGTNNPPVGGRAANGTFAGGSAALAPGGCVSFRFDNGLVDPKKGINVNVDLFLDKRNSILIKNRTWTEDGVVVASAGPAGGWSVDQPVAGGNGGTQTLAGGGEGGQEGGGGVGNYVHAFEIINLEGVDRVLTELKLLASTVFYDDLVADVPWASVDAFALATGGTIAANSSMVFEFNTTGSYDNTGHIYSAYSFADAPEEIVFGDHPVEPIPVAPTITLMLAGLVLLRRNRIGQCRDKPAA